MYRRQHCCIHVKFSSIEVITLFSHVNENWVARKRALALTSVVWHMSVTLEPNTFNVLYCWPELTWRLILLNRSSRCSIVSGCDLLAPSLCRLILNRSSRCSVDCDLRAACSHLRSSRCSIDTVRAARTGPISAVHVVVARMTTGSLLFSPPLESPFSVVYRWVDSTSIFDWTHPLRWTGQFFYTCIYTCVFAPPFEHAHRLGRRTLGRS